MLTWWTWWWRYVTEFHYQLSSSVKTTRQDDGLEELGGNWTEVKSLGAKQNWLGGGMKCQTWRVCSCIDAGAKLRNVESSIVSFCMSRKGFKTQITFLSFNNSSHASVLPSESKLNIGESLIKFPDFKAFGFWILKLSLSWAKFIDTEVRLTDPCTHIDDQSM